MNRKETLAAIKALPGMTARYNAGIAEYRVTYDPAVWLAYDPSRDARECRQLSEEVAYYTGDGADALATALRMSGAEPLDDAPAEDMHVHIQWRDENYGHVYSKSAFRLWQTLVDERAAAAFRACVRRAGYEGNATRAAWIAITDGAPERLRTELEARGFTVTA